MTTPPTQLTVQFSEPINIQQLAYQAFASRAQATLPQVFVDGTDGTKYYPRFDSYNRATNQATFQMLDGLANGSYDLHLSGPGGLTDLGGNPIAGNDPSGDYVIPFQVTGPERAISGNMTDGYTVVSQAEQGVPQDLGVLFPRELQAGVTVIRGPDAGTSPPPATTEDDYVIQLLQSQNYSFTLSGDDLPGGAVGDAEGCLGCSQSHCSSRATDWFFSPRSSQGRTRSPWEDGPRNQSASVSYQLTMDLVGQQDNAPPLVDGPAPALQIHLAGIDRHDEPGANANGWHRRRWQRDYLGIAGLGPPLWASRRVKRPLRSRPWAWARSAGRRAKLGRRRLRRSRSPWASRLRRFSAAW